MRCLLYCDIAPVQCFRDTCLADLGEFYISAARSVVINQIFQYSLHRRCLYLPIELHHRHSFAVKFMLNASTVLKTQ